MLGRCLKLEKVNLTGLKKLTDEGFTCFIPTETQKIVPDSALKNMKKLTLEMCDYVSDSVLEQIKRLHP